MCDIPNPISITVSTSNTILVASTSKLFKVTQGNKYNNKKPHKEITQRERENVKLIHKIKKQELKIIWLKCLLVLVKKEAWMESQIQQLFVTSVDQPYTHPFQICQFTICFLFPFFKYVNSFSLSLPICSCYVGQVIMFVLSFFSFFSFFFVNL